MDNKTFTAESRETMNEGLASIQPKAPSMKNRAWAIVHEAGAAGIHATDVAIKMGEMEYSVRPRLRELRLDGKIKQDGKSVNSRGRTEVVWKSTEFTNAAA